MTILEILRKEALRDVDGLGEVYDPATVERILSAHNVQTAVELMGYFKESQCNLCVGKYEIEPYPDGTYSVILWDKDLRIAHETQKLSLPEAIHYITERTK